MKKKEERSDLDLFKRLLAQARPFWAHIAGLLLLNLLAAPLALLLPVPLKVTVDSVLGDEPLPWFLAPLVPESLASSASGLLLFVAILVVGIALATQTRGLAAAALKVYAAEHLVLRLRARLFGHVQRLSLGFHDQRGIADSLYRIQYDATAIEGVAVSGVIPLISSTVTLLAMLFVTLRLDWQLAAIAIAIVPLIVIIGQAYRRKLRVQWSRAKALESSVLSIVEEVLSTLRVVKAFGQEAHEESRFTDAGHETVRARVVATVNQGVFGLLLGLTVAMGTAVVLYVGVRHVQEGLLSLGDLLLVMMYLAMLYQPIEAIGQKVAALQQALASANRVYTLLDATPEVKDGPHARSLDRAGGSVSFHDVSFGYKPGEEILKGITFQAQAGSRVGIAGETGAGKSTLIGLLPRFHDPTSGLITLDGVDLREYRLRDLRNQFSIVLQDAVLFSTTIGENIEYGRPGATRDEIVAAAKQANVHGIIESLSDAYETVVGDRGLMLSGGQRQLVALARAFLRDAPILILDEPTSAIDVHTESMIMDALERLMSDRTTFMISHRLYTLDSCDQVLFLDQGALADDGSARVRSLSDAAR